VEQDRRKHSHRTWAYSINGGTFINFQTNAANGNIWQTFVYSFTGLVLQNGDAFLCAHVGGASGSNGI